MKYKKGIYVILFVWSIAVFLNEVLQLSNSFIFCYIEHVMYYPVPLINTGNIYIYINLPLVILLSLLSFEIMNKKIIVNNNRKYYTRDRKGFIPFSIFFALFYTVCVMSAYAYSMYYGFTKPINIILLILFLFFTIYVTSIYMYKQIIFNFATYKVTIKVGLMFIVLSFALQYLVAILGYETDFFAIVTAYIFAVYPFVILIHIILFKFFVEKLKKTP